MLISNNFNHYNNNYTSVNTRQRVGNFRALAVDTVSFGLSDKDESLENKMKRISGLHNPYSDIIMLSDPEFDKYMKKVKKRPNVESMLNLLHGYKENMFEPELQTYELLSGIAKEINPQESREMDLHDILNELYVGVKINLARKQLNVLSEINDYIENTHGETKQNLTKIFEPVKASISDDSFRINPLTEKVIKTKGIDKFARKNILELMKTFPNSRNSAEVFIVNNANRSHEEIAEAFLTPSRVSIEHIRPQSRGGASSVSNYLLASKRMNSVRSSMPFYQFVAEHPKIPGQIDRYFNDLVKKINQGGLTYMAMALPDISETLRTQSRGAIDIEVVDLSNEEQSNVSKMKEHLEQLLRKFGK